MMEDRAVQIIEPTAVELISRADFDVQIATAKRYPMHSSKDDIKRFQDKAIACATIDEETAESCLYAIPISGDNMYSGPSVRFAEIIVASYGNTKAAARIIEINGEHGYVVAQGVCHDLENNVSQSVEVRRNIKTSSGQLYNDRLIQLTCNAACSIAYRNAVYKIIPAAFCNKILDAVEKEAIGTETTIQSRLERAIKKFSLIGISPRRTLQIVGKDSRESVTLDDMKTLIGVYQAIRQGEITAEEVISRGSKSKIQEAIDAKRKTSAPAEEETPEPPKQTKKGAPKSRPKQEEVLTLEEMIEAVRMTARKKGYTDEQLIAACADEIPNFETNERLTQYSLDDLRQMRGYLEAML